MTVPDGRLSGLAPVIGPEPRVLILGSFPSSESLARREYYGNPRNQFWPIMERLFGIPAGAPYRDRVEGLKEHGVALWDVVERCRREGSSDAAIRDASANDIEGMLAAHPTIRAIMLNGRTGAMFWLRRLCPLLWTEAGIPILTLPSTSPAHARATLEEKVRAWESICGYIRD